MSRRKDKTPLNYDQVDFIRNAHSRIVQIRLSHMFQIDQSTVSSIQNRRSHDYIMPQERDAIWYAEDRGAHAVLISHPDANTLVVTRGSHADQLAYAEMLVWLLNHTACEPQ